MNDWADLHIATVDAIIQAQQARIINEEEAAFKLANLGYNFDEVWEMIQESKAKSKVVKL